MIHALLLSLFAAAGAFLFDDVEKYCGLCKPELNAGDIANHTVCLYESLGPTCTGAMDGGVTQEEKELILYVHNALRAKVASGQELRGLPEGGPQPPAANMMVLKWDEELATIAQLWADQCRFEHDCRHVGDFKVGQNIAQYWNDLAPIIQWKPVIEGWYEEVGNWSAKDTASFKFTGHEVMTAHYTQVVWANTRFVGCGRRAYRNGPFYVENYVCNYGPTGNYWFEPVYIPGEPCTLCPADSECSDGVLCEAGGGNKTDLYAYRYSSPEIENTTYGDELIELNVTSGAEENELNPDYQNDKKLWDMWYTYLTLGNAEA